MIELPHRQCILYFLCVTILRDTGWYVMPRACGFWKIAVCYEEVMQQWRFQKSCDNPERLP